jgi:hypothetical protein
VRYGQLAVSILGALAPTLCRSEPVAPRQWHGSIAVHAPLQVQRPRVISTPQFKPSMSAPPKVAGVSGDAVGRHTRVNAAAGGPAIYDAKKGAVISGASVRQKFQRGF